MDASANAVPPLSTRLRLETRHAHVRAERSGIMRQLLRGEIDRGEYVVLLQELTRLYAALEDALDRRQTHPLVAPLETNTLRRLPRLLADLSELAGTSLVCAPTCDATRAYVLRVRDAAEHEPARLVAHAYVRYLGDLSGGQILRGIVGRMLGSDAGTSFYDFAPHDPLELKRRFRVALDALPLAPAEADVIVDEAGRAFALHEALFVELEGGR
jgi:heme oxygenase (biliverdin-producing, ferredoxin)